MKYLFILILIFLFFKSFYYGLFEIKEKQNKSGGFAIILLASLGLVFPASILILFY